MHIIAWMRAADDVPQYLAPNDQMIYHLSLAKNQDHQTDQPFVFEADYFLLSGSRNTLFPHIVIDNFLLVF